MTHCTQDQGFRQEKKALQNPLAAFGRVCYGPVMRVYCCLLLVVATGLASCRRQDVRTVVISVPEMKNEACVARVRTALETVQIVNPAWIVPDVARREVTVRYDSVRHSLKNLEFTIADAGFTANDVPANAIAQQALPPECR